MRLLDDHQALPLLLPPASPRLASLLLLPCYDQLTSGAEAFCCLRCQLYDSVVVAVPL